ncbi:MAG: hypothetical protein BWX67_02305 [Thermotogae bacterium ADurb.Bin062]|nr:MAG: hypothetical protein BWX67_02305 [Thermotogota bacterium ADurb.Bin062]
MANESGLRRQYTMTQKDGTKWVFTPEVGDALGGLPGLMVFTAAVGKTVKTGSIEIAFKGYGLFDVTKHGKTVKVDLIERESGFSSD